MRGFASSLLFISLACAGCAPGQRIASFAPGEEIPLKVLTLSVSRWEAVPPSLPYLSSENTSAGEKAVAVFARWRGLEEVAEMDRRVFIESFLEHRLTLVDSDGFTYAAISAIPTNFYYGSSYDMNAPADWAVIYHVYVDSGGYSLRVRHPEPGVHEEEGKEGFDVAVVEFE